MRLPLPPLAYLGPRLPLMRSLIEYERLPRKPRSKPGRPTPHSILSTLIQ